MTIRHLTGKAHGGTLVEATDRDITLYVRTTGDDGNDGLTEGNALATIQEAVDRVPKFIEHDVTIDIGEGNFKGAYISGFIKSSTSSDGTFTISGTLDNPTLTTGTTSGTATGGTTVSVTDSNQTWTTDELIGYFALVDGEYRVIYDNDATSFQILEDYPASTSGKDYEILEPKTVIDTAESIEGGYSGINVGPMSIRVALQNMLFDGLIVGVMANRSIQVPQMTRLVADGCTYGFYAQGIFTQSPAEQLVMKSCTYATYYWTSTVADFFSGCLAYDNDYGFYISQVASRTQLAYCAAINNNGYGIRIYNGLQCSLFDVICTGNGANGIELRMCQNVEIVTDGANDVNISGNTDNGIACDNILRLYVRGDAYIQNNGGYGIAVDDSVGSHTNLYVKTNVTISGNSSGGIIANRLAFVRLKDVDGSSTGYGLWIESGAHAHVTSNTAITGTIADATVDEGTTSLDWSTDFSSNGDVVVNLDTGSRIERKD